jgi:hypothetical protein
MTADGIAVKKQRGVNFRRDNKSFSARGSQINLQIRMAMSVTLRTFTEKKANVGMHSCQPMKDHRLTCIV